MPDPSLTTLEGRLLGGRYRLNHLVAAGGMAQVWEATDEVLTRPVAVKLLHPHLAADASFVERFRREAVSAARLAHPSIVSIFDTCSEDGLEAIVMELVTGTTLRKLLDDRKVLEPENAVGIVAEVADALEAAHRAGLVHRDVKPANILLSDDGRVLVADFGIAKAAEGADLTGTGTTLGTAKYLAPEQVEGKPVDARADVYALGVVLYECLCGRAPFVADTEAATALARLQHDPVKPRHVRAGIPKALEDVTMRALAREPSGRYATAGDLRSALLAVSRGEVPVWSAPGTPLAGSPDSTVAVAPTRDRTPAGGVEVHPVSTQPKRGRVRVLPVLVICLLAAALIIGGILITRTGHSSSETSSTPAVASAGVRIASAAAFDPFGGDGEHDAEAPLAIDSKPDTFWQTEGYAVRTIGTKPGVGLVLKLNSSAKLSTIKITSDTNDWSFAIYVAVSAQTTLDGWGQPVATKAHTQSGTTTIDLNGKQGGAVLIWLTDLGDEGGGEIHAHINEVQVSAA